jgi:hypothetical protein
MMKLTHKFAELTPEKRPQDPYLDEMTVSAWPPVLGPFLLGPVAESKQATRPAHLEHQ